MAINAYGAIVWKSKATWFFHELHGEYSNEKGTINRSSEMVQIYHLTKPFTSLVDKGQYQTYWDYTDGEIATLTFSYIGQIRYELHEKL